MSTSRTHRPRSIGLLPAVFLLSSCGGGGGSGAAPPAGPTPGDDASLAELTLSSELDQPFQSNQTDYTSSVGFLGTTVVVTPTAADPAATVTVNGSVVPSGTASPPLPLTEGTNRIETTVTAEDGSTRRYTIDVAREDLGAFAQRAYGKASTTDEGDFLGWSVALAGDTLAIGMPRENSAATGVNGDATDDGAPLSGAVVVFERVGDAWRQEAYLKASNTGPGDAFGFAVALSGDTLVVGAPSEESSATGIDGDETSDDAIASGAAYVFRRTGAAWRQEAYLKASNTDRGDFFGFSVALSGDTLAVGAPEEDSSATNVNGDGTDDGASSSGAVYLFEREGDTWGQEAYLKASNTDADDEFGEHLALSGDTLAVGAVFEDSAATGVGGDETDDGAADAGAVYLFTQDAAGWRQETYLKAPNTGEDDQFGSALALSGATLAVGAIREDSAATGANGDATNDDAPKSGAVYLFERSEAGWRPEAYLKASNTDPEDNFGRAVDLAGGTLAVGALNEDGNAFGVNGDGTNDDALRSGAVYLFERDRDGWRPRVYLKASNTDAFDRFGSALALAGDTLVVGAPEEDGGSTGIGGDPEDDSAQVSGAVYLFR